jgi:hypothetical protein
MTEELQCQWCGNQSELTECADCCLPLCGDSDHTHQNDERTVCSECWHAPGYFAILGEWPLCLRRFLAARYIR